MSVGEGSATVTGLEMEVDHAAVEDEVAVFPVAPPSENSDSDGDYDGGPTVALTDVGIGSTRPSRVRNAPVRFRDKDQWWNHGDMTDGEFEEEF